MGLENLESNEPELKGSLSTLGLRTTALGSQKLRETTVTQIG